MRLLFFCSCILVLGSSSGNRLDATLNALENGLEYFRRNVNGINFDAVFCVRKTQEQLQSFLEHEPQVFEGVRPRLEKLRELAKQTADEGTPLIYAKVPEFSAYLGRTLDENRKIPWYPSQETSEEHVVEPVNCSVYYYDWEKEEDCYHQAIGGNGKLCDVDTSCFDFNNEYQQRFYGLTHQVLFWQLMENKGCIDSVPALRQKRFCSNVMRDVRHIARARFPEQNRDIFLEQVGVCGFWGFKDFNQPQWLEQILEWQQDSGCYDNLPDIYNKTCYDEIPEESLKRVKRRELQIEDGCFSHTTGVALMALVTNVRFEAEKLYQIEHNDSTYPLKDSTYPHKDLSDPTDSLMSDAAACTIFAERCTLYQMSIILFAFIIYNSISANILF